MVPLVEREAVAARRNRNHRVAEPLGPVGDAQQRVPPLARLPEQGKARFDALAPPEARDVLLSYSWPGNVRELRTAIETAVVMCRGEKIAARDLPAAVRQIPPPGAANASTTASGRGHGLDVAVAEKDLIVRALKQSEGNRTRAAQKLGMSRRTLHRKLHVYQIENL